MGMNQTDLASLLEEAEAISNEDVRQEYITLRLEGQTREFARHHSRSALPANAAARGIRDHTGAPPMGGQGIEPWQVEKVDNVISLTMDTRTDEEREAAWAREDFAQGYVQALDPLTRRIVELRYGVGTGEPMGPSDVARECQVSISKVERTIQRLRKHAQAAA